MMFFLNQADSYGEGLEGTSSFVEQNSEDDNNSEADSTPPDGSDEDISEEQFVSELPDLPTQEQNFEENPRMPSSAGK